MESIDATAAIAATAIGQQQFHARGLQSLLPVRRYCTKRIVSWQRLPPLRAVTVVQRSRYSYAYASACSLPHCCCCRCCCRCSRRRRRLAKPLGHSLCRTANRSHVAVEQTTPPRTSAAELLDLFVGVGVGVSESRLGIAESGCLHRDRANLLARFCRDLISGKLAKCLVQKPSLTWQLADTFLDQHVILHFGRPDRIGIHILENDHISSGKLGEWSHWLGRRE